MEEFYLVQLQLANKRLVAEVNDVNCNIPTIHQHESIENDDETTLVCVEKEMEENNLAIFESRTKQKNTLISKPVVNSVDFLTKNN